MKTIYTVKKNNEILCTCETKEQAELVKKTFNELEMNELLRQMSDYHITVQEVQS